MANTPSKANPAEEKADLSIPAGYKPMSVGMRRLEVAEKDGWHRHWFRATAGNIARAKQAGYRFVEQDEVDLNDFDLAGDGQSKGTDLGSRVTVTSGDGTDKLVLMECPEHLYQHGQNIHMEEVHKTAEALKGGMVGKGKQGETGKDVENRYSEVSVKGRNLFTRKS
jgi:hypothetical protein